MKSPLTLSHCPTEAAARDLAARARAEGSDARVCFDYRYDAWAVAYFGPLSPEELQALRDAPSDPAAP